MKRSIKVLLTIAAIFIAFSFYTSRTPHTDSLDILLEEKKVSKEDSRAELATTIVDAYLADYNVPSLVVAIVEKGKAPVFINRGNMKRGSDNAVNENTVYQLGSLSKTFTAILARKLEAEGILDLEAHILKYIPNNFSEETIEKLSPIRVKDVLLHQAGFEREPISTNRIPLGGPIVGAYSKSEVLDDLEHTVLINKPGTQMSYSNFGYAVLGLIMENASQKSYNTLIDEYISIPFQMKQTTSDFNHNFDNKLATPYIPEFKFIKNCPFEFEMQTAAGGVFSTAEDLSKMMTIQMKAYEEIKVDNPLILNNETIKMWDSPYSPLYGYGVFELGEPGELMLGHSGDTDGFASSYYFSPDQDFGMILLTSMGGKWFQEMEGRMREEMLK